MVRRLVPLLTFALFVCPPGARAQQVQGSYEQDAAPAYVSFVDGRASIERDGRVEESLLNMPLLSGDRLRTADGRVEVRFNDGSLLHLDSRTTIDVESDDLVRLIDGRLRLVIAGRNRAVVYRIDSPAGSARLTQPGEYRLALLRSTDETQLELAVLRGAGEVFTDHGSTTVRSGQRAYASVGLAPSYAYAYNSAAWDSFDRWSEERRGLRLGASTQYLPSDMQTYSPVFDEYGDWQYAQPYGYVWYPRVAAGWRPYYYGRWMSYPRYGWTWIGLDRFAWPTHHYGRWGFSAGLWFWIPSSRWAPAYVSWGYAPSYVSWCPLGWDDRPVVSINIFNVGPRYYSAGSGFYGAHAWTVVSRPYFDSRARGFVHDRAVAWDRLDAAHRPAFEARPSAPLARDVAVPRGGRDVAVPRGSGMDVAVPRGSAPITGLGGQMTPGSRALPRYTNRGDEIVRSQTARPVAPAPSRVAGPAPSRVEGSAPSRVAVPRGDGARTMPQMPMPDRGERTRVPNERQPVFATPERERAQPRSSDAPGMPRPGGGAATPSRAPRVQGPAPSRVEPPRYEPGAGGYEPGVRRVDPGPSRAEMPGPSRIERAPGRIEAPAPSRVERPAPSRIEAPPPSRGEGPPPQRSAPAPERSAPRETAHPRSAPSGGNGGAAPSRRGRGGN